MLKRQKTGTATCYSCKKLISIDSKECIHCGSRNPGLWGYSRAVRRLGNVFGFANVVTWGCICLYALSLAGGLTLRQGNDFLAPSDESLFLLGSTGAVPLFQYGRWWTVLSAGWLHGGLFHIAFNLVWIRYLAPSMTKAYGAARLSILYILSIISGGLLTSLIFLLIPGQGAPFAVGASGGLFGLFGALVAHGQRAKDNTTKQQALIYAGIGFIAGLVMPNIDNWGHLGGFLGGYLMAQTPWLNSQKTPKVRDVFIALAIIGLVPISFLLSLIDGL